MSIFLKSAATASYLLMVSAATTFSGATTANAGFGTCVGNVCEAAVIEGVRCATPAVTNAADTWTMSVSYDPKGSDPFFEGEGAGEDNSPVKWMNGAAVFKAKKDKIYISFTANGSPDLQVKAGGGAADGSVATILTGEDGADNDFNDIIVSVVCTSP